jgi:predicted Zn-ribbon and HTH transcriptional regulator
MVSTKAELIRDMLEDGMSPKEIREALKEDDIKVTSQYIYNVKRRWAEDGNTSKREETDDDDDDDDDGGDGGDYITRFPKEKRKSEKMEMEDYECGACGATWKAPRNKYQACCPGCGATF